MLRINLLPIKAARKHETAKHEVMIVAGVVAVVLVVLYILHAGVQSDIDDTNDRIAKVNAEIKRLKQDVVRAEDFKNKTETVNSKIKVITGLEKMRVGPARLLDDLSTIITDEEKVWLTKLSEVNGHLTLEGGAMEHENISTFQLALERRSKLISRVNLSLVKAVDKDGFKFLEWKMTCKANYTAG